MLNTYITDDGFRLGGWISEQRKRQDTLSIEQKSLLENLPGWVWNIFSSQWNEGLDYMHEFVNQNGHSRVPQYYKTENGYPLGQWVSERRKKKDQLSFERRVQLEVLPGWAWNKVEADWEKNYRYLSAFADQHGHCKVGVDYRTTDGYNLREWIFTQRKAIDKMPPEQKARLEALSGWAWNQRNEQWEQKFHYLQEFAEQEGHCNIPKNYQTDDGDRLGLWVSNQKRIKDEMLPERKARLEALPGWAWDVLAEQWETNFRSLMEFADREGHCRVPANYRTSDGLRLGSWVSNQRAGKDGLPAERKKRLEEMPGWLWRVKDNVDD